MLQFSRLSYLDIGLFVLIGLACVLVGLMWAQHPAIEGDGIYYLVPFHNLVHGDGYTYVGEPSIIFPPGYGLLAYPVSLVVRNIEVSGILVSAAGYILSIVLAFAIGAYLFTRRAGVLAAAFVTLSPYMVQLAAHTLSEPIYSCIYLLSFFLFLQIIRQDKDLRWYVAMGVVLGINYLIRPEAFLPGVLVIGTLFVFSFRRWWRPALTALIFAAVSFPYIWFLHEQLDRWTIAGKTSMTAIYYSEMYEGTPEVELQRRLETDPAYFEQGLVQYVRTRGFDLLPRFGHNFVSIISQTLGVIRHALVGLALALVAALIVGKLHVPAFSLSRPSPPVWKTALAVAIYCSAIPGFLLFYVTYRFVTPYSLILLILVAGLVDYLLQQIGNQRLEKMALYSLIGAGFISVLSIFPFFNSIALDTMLNAPSSYGYTRAAGEWLHENVDMTDRSMMGIGKVHVIAFYASAERLDVPSTRDVEVPPDLRLEDTAVYMAVHTIDYLILERAYMRARPQLQRLWDAPESAGDYGLTLLHDDPQFQVYALARVG